MRYFKCAIIIASKDSSHQGNTNKKHNIIPLNIHQNDYNQKIQLIQSDGKDEGNE